MHSHFPRTDPGECPICGAAHCTCTTAAGPPTVTLLPQRDAAAAPEYGDGSDDRPFTTATYRGTTKKGTR